MLAADRVVTLVDYDRLRQKYHCTVLEGVSIHQRVERVVSDKGVLSEVVAVIRIPEAVLSERLPKTGDFVVFDRVEGITDRRDIEQYGHTVVISVGDNRRGGIPHIKLTCK